MNTGAGTHTTTPIRLVLADDQELLRTGYRMVLDAQPDMDVVAEASDGLTAVSTAHEHQPDVILMDVRMPGIDGIEATRRITTNSPNVRVLILTTFDLDQYVMAGLQAGASGFLLKDALTADLLSAIRTVVTGDAVIAPSATRRLVDTFLRTPAPALTGPDLNPALNHLTPREHDVLIALAAGLSNTEIADQLVISETTVKSHVAHILAKLGLRNRVQVVIRAYDLRLVQPKPRDG